MAKTNYQRTPPAGLTTPSYNPNPLVAIQITGQGKLSKPVPPAPVKFTRKLLPAPTPVGAPGAEGTI
jgi:hypothetical protein